MRILAPVLIALVPTLALSQTASTVPQAEQLDVATLRAPYPHRVFAMNTFTEVGVKILDGDNLKIEGLIPTNDTGVLALDPNDRFFYISESIWTLGNRGTRQDMVSVYDARSLNLVGEIALPAGRLIIDARTHAFDISASGKFAYVYNMQPASSEVVVNLDQRRVAGVIEMPGCALAFPWGDAGFSSLCGDGSLASVSLGADGKSTGMSHTARFFDADNDPIFEESLVDRSSGRALFLSYTGLIYPAQLSAKPIIEKPWSLQVAAGMPAAGTGVQELAWRPGGVHMIAWHKSTNRLYVLMHMGNHWSSKEAGTELWVLDIPSRALLKRLQLPEPCNSIAISQDAEPLLYALTKTGDLLTMDLETGQEKIKAKTNGGRIAWVPGF